MIKEISPNQALSDLKLYFRWRVQRAAKLVALAKRYCQLNDKNILEVGCGFGPIAANLNPKKSKIYSIDPSIKSLALFKKFNPDKKINVKIANNENLPFVKSFNVPRFKEKRVFIFRSNSIFFINSRTSSL